MYNNPLKILLITSVLLCITYWGFAIDDTTRVYFRLDVPMPEQDAIKRLDSLLYMDAINASQELLIIGYADHLGTNTYNDTLSKKRADNVKRYLVSMGIPEKNVTLVTGRGEVPRDVELPKGYAADRRVDIVVLRGKKTSSPVKKEIVKPVLAAPRRAISLNTMTVFDPATIEVGQLFVLDRIFFHTGRHVVVDESLPEMERLYKVLDENPTVEIRIEGHVCCVHPSVDALDLDTGELLLSVNRAKFIYEYLVAKGIDEARLSYEGFGKKRPLRRTEFTQEDQDMNKRVEIRILNK